MWWKLKRSVYEQQKGVGNKRAMEKLVHSDSVPGIIAYKDETPIGWCAISSRDAYPVLDRSRVSRVLKRVDDQPVWSLPCLFIDKPYRKKGISALLLKEAVSYAFSHGAKIVEAYPVVPKKAMMPDVFAWTGFYSAFLKAGFKEVARRSATRPIMRVEMNNWTVSRI